MTAQANNNENSMKIMLLPRKEFKAFTKIILSSKWKKEEKDDQQSWD